MMAVLVAGCRTSSTTEQTSAATSSVDDQRPTTSVTVAPSVENAMSATVIPTAPTESAPPLDTKHDDVRRLSVKEQQQYLIELVSSEQTLTPERRQRVQDIVQKSDWLSFGNPKVSKPAMTKAECRARRAEGQWHAADARCGAPNMVAIEGEDGEPSVCIDQYEFPNVACEYPVVWVRASEAAGLCEAVGKRLCDAHEWEGACAGEVLSVEQDYPWDHIPKSIAHSPTRAQRLWLEYEHNRTRDVRWAYGDHAEHALCGTGAVKEQKCEVLDFSTCSTSSYPAGAFSKCVSALGVYDQHGNAAEHMNLPLAPAELTSKGGSGWTEMKGSWFIFSSQETHPDDCRWRAKSWHTTRVKEWNSHRNYHLGFRCCRDVE